MEILTCAPTPKLMKLLTAVYDAGRVILTKGPGDRIEDNTHPALNVRELHQAAVLGYLARAVENNHTIYTITALGRTIAKLLPGPREIVHRKDACPRCGIPGAAGEHWVPQGETLKETGFWICDMIDDGVYDE